MNRIVLLGDEVELLYGKGLPEKNRQSGKYPVFGSNGVVGTHKEALVDDQGIVIGRKGTVGRVTWSGMPFWPIDTTYYVRPKHSGNLKYWYYQLQALGLSELNSHSAVPGLNRDEVYALPIVKRSSEEQEKIVGILDAIDKKIELNRRMNETLEEICQTLFRKYFIMNPEAQNWEERPLDEVANFLNGLAMQKYPPDSDKVLPVIKIREMSNGITDNTDFASVNIPEQYIVKDGELLFSWSGTLIAKFWCEGEGALNQHLFKVTSDSYPKWFYYYWVKHHLKSFIETAAGKATTMGHIQRKHLSTAMVQVPDEQKLNELSEIFSPLLSIQIDNSVESRKLRELRDSLLPRLISGRVKI